MSANLSPGQIIGRQWRAHLVELARCRRLAGLPNPWYCPRCGWDHLAQNPPTCRP